MGSGCGELWAVGSDAGAAFDLWRLSAAPPGGGRTAGLVSLEALEAVQREADFAQRAGAFFDCNILEPSCHALQISKSL